MPKIKRTRDDEPLAPPEKKSKADTTQVAAPKKKHKKAKKAKDKDKDRKKDTAVEDAYSESLEQKKVIEASTALSAMAKKQSKKKIGDDKDSVSAAMLPAPDPPPTSDPKTSAVARKAVSAAVPPKKNVVKSAPQRSIDINEGASARWRVDDEYKKTLKSGRWSKEDVALLEKNIRNYCVTHDIGDIVAWLNERKGKKSKLSQSFYLEVANGLQRPPQSVYREVQRRITSQNRSKPYTVEDLQKLHDLQSKLGNNWTEIALKLERSADSVRDKFRLLRGNSGKWTKEEEEKLTKLVYESTGAAPGSKLDVGSGISWKAISAKMGSRNEHQCMGKWYSKLEWKQVASASGESSRWSETDSNQLIKLVKEANVVNEVDIDWKSLADKFPGPYRNGWALRKKWIEVKKRLTPKYLSMSFEDVVETLYQRSQGASWQDQDVRNLTRCVAEAVNVNGEEIDFKEVTKRLNAMGGSYRNSKEVRKKWSGLKKSIVPSHQTMKVEDVVAAIVDYYVKQ